MLQKLIVIEWQRGRFEAVDALLEQVLRMQLSWKTPVESLTRDPALAIPAGSKSLLPIPWPSRVTQNVVRITLGETARESIMMPTGPLQAVDFGDVRLFCLATKKRLLEEQKMTEQWMAELKAKAAVDRQAAWDLWGLIVLDDDNSLRELAKESPLTTAIRLASFGDADGHLALIDTAFLLDLHSNVGKSVIHNFAVKWLDADELSTIGASLEAILRLAPQELSAEKVRALVDLYRRQDQEPLLTEIVARLKSDGASREQLQAAFWILCELKNTTSADLLELVDRLNSMVIEMNSVRGASGGSAFRWNVDDADDFARAILSAASDRTDSAACQRIFEWWISQQSENDRNAYCSPRFLIWPLSRELDMAPHAGQVCLVSEAFDEPDGQFIVEFSSFLSADKITASMTDVTVSRKGNESVADRQLREITLAVTGWGNGSYDDALGHLARAASLNPDDRGLKIRVIDLCQMTGRFEQALKLVETLPESDTDFIRQKYLKMLELSARLKNTDKARAALDRLSGFFLDPDSTKMISSCLKALDLTDEASQFQAKMGKPASHQLPRRGYVQASPFLYGKRLEALRKGENTTATVDFARQILRRTQNAAWFSGRSSEDRDKLREEAFRILRETGELDQIIERKKAQFQASPRSEILARDLEDSLRAAWQDEEADHIRRQWLEAAMSTSPTNMAELAQRLYAESDVDHAEAVVFRLMEDHANFFWSVGVSQLWAILENSSHPERIAGLATQFVTQHPEDTRAVANAQREAVHKIASFAEDSSSKAEGLLGQLFADTSEVPFSVQLERQKKLWTTPQTFRALSRLMIPRTEAEALAPRYGWSRTPLDTDMERIFTVEKSSPFRAVVEGLPYSFKEDFRREVDQAERDFPGWRLALPLRLLFAITEKNLDEAHLLVEQMKADSDFQIPEGPAYELAVLLTEQGQDWKLLALDVLKRCIETSPGRIRLASPVVDRLVSISGAMGRTEEARQLIETHVDLTLTKNIEQADASSILVRLDHPIAALRLLAREDLREHSMLADEEIPKAQQEALLRIQPEHIIRDLKQSLSARQSDHAMLMRLGVETDAAAGLLQLKCKSLDRVLTGTKLNERQSEELADALKHALTKRSAEPAVIALAAGFLLASDQNAAIQSVQPELESWWQRPVADLVTKNGHQPREFVAGEGAELCLLVCFSEFCFDETRRPLVKSYFNYCERFARSSGDRKLLDLVLTSEAKYYETVNEMDAAQEIRERIPIKPAPTLSKEDVDVELQHLLTVP
ncbi:MAG: tetratricopeptide repeat protein [Planctomycetota bacterium]